MKKNNKSDMPVGKLTRVEDFLPPPEQLIMPEETVKVTLSLTKSSLDFFKRKAQKQGTKYQRMIRELVDRYTKIYH